MTTKELYKMNFEQAIEILQIDNNIVSFELLKDFAIEQIKDDNFFVAIHILSAMNDNESNYYSYDFSMGTLETPTPLETLEDLEQFCD